MGGKTEFATRKQTAAATDELDWTTEEVVPNSFSSLQEQKGVERKKRKQRRQAAAGVPSSGRPRRSPNPQPFSRQQEATHNDILAKIKGWGETSLTHDERDFQVWYTQAVSKGFRFSSSKRRDDPSMMRRIVLVILFMCVLLLLVFHASDIYQFVWNGILPTALLDCLNQEASWWTSSTNAVCGNRLSEITRYYFKDLNYSSFEEILAGGCWIRLCFLHIMMCDYTWTSVSYLGDMCFRLFVKGVLRCLWQVMSHIMVFYLMSLVLLYFGIVCIGHFGKPKPKRSKSFQQHLEDTRFSVLFNWALKIPCSVCAKLYQWYTRTDKCATPSDPFGTTYDWFVCALNICEDIHAWCIMRGDRQMHQGERNARQMHQGEPRAIMWAMQREI